MKTSSITLPARRNSVFHGCFNGVIVAQSPMSWRFKALGWHRNWAFQNRQPMKPAWRFAWRPVASRDDFTAWGFHPGGWLYLSMRIPKDHSFGGRVWGGVRPSCCFRLVLNIRRETPAKPHKHWPKRLSACQSVGGMDNQTDCQPATGRREIPVVI